MKIRQRTSGGFDLLLVLGWGCGTVPRHAVGGLERDLQLVLTPIMTRAREVRTRTRFALHILQARLRTFPSAWTTSGASSRPNLRDVSIM